MTVFYLVRHAVTDVTGKRLPAPEVPLSEAGRAQATTLASALAGADFDAIYSSPIIRTLETARVIANHHSTKVQVRPALADVDYGRWVNRPIAPLTKTKLWEKVRSWPSAVRFPEGETIREVQIRAIGAIEQIVEEVPKGIVCCVSHADVIRLAIAHFMGIHIDLFQRMSIGPASVSLLSVSDAGPHVFGIGLGAEGIPMLKKRGSRPKRRG
jgi:probable phosphomutase (TIGR03848 family)